MNFINELKEIKKMDAKEFLKELKVPKRWRGEDEIGDWLYYEKGVIEAREQYHQSQVNNGVLDDVIVCDNCTELNRKTCFLGVTCPKCNKPFRSIRS